jgi:isopenicillin N synthase-like dioxygenase
MLIPAIDLSAFADPSSDADGSRRAAAAKALDDAASDVGFFHIRIPGLADAAQRLLAACRQFHSLPIEAKRSVSNELSPMRRGFNAVWDSQGGSCAAKPLVDPPDPKETFMLGSEGDTSPMHGPNLVHERKSNPRPSGAHMLAP